MYQLKLNEDCICSGDLKSLTALFNDLSGLSFARSKSKASWLDKMSATESYSTYLHIKAAEYKITRWEGSLSLVDDKGDVQRVHLFATHQQIKPASNSKAV